MNKRIKEERDILYNFQHISFYRKFIKTIAKNKNFLSNQIIKKINDIWEIIDIQQKIADPYLKVILLTFEDPYFKFDEKNKLLFNCFHNNLISLMTATYLIEKGLYGPARIILRHSFEGLMIAKYSNISGCNNLFARWENGEDIKLTPEVFNKIKSPYPQPFKDFWKILCQWSHSTIYSMQFSIKSLDESQRQLEITLVFINILLEFNYHLLGSHIITTQLKYHHDRYFEKGKIQQLMKKIKKHFSLARIIFEPDGKKLIRDYKRKWKL